MNRRALSWAGAIAALTLWCGGAGAQEKNPPPAHQHDHAAQAEQDPKMQGQATQAMTQGHQHNLLHMQFTALRPKTAEDEKRAAELLATLQKSLEKYRDYRVAEAEGYQIFLPNLPLPEYHFTNYKLGFLAAFYFDPARPTSLLYKKTADGYELVGAMYTAPHRAGEETLHERVPLSVTRWHLHTNLCLPPREQAGKADWTRFGLTGSIATQEACAEAGGRFLLRIFGWMVHVYPWENSPEKIWKH